MKRRDFLKASSQGACLFALSSCTGGMGGNGGSGSDLAPSLNSDDSVQAFFAPPQMLGEMIDGVRVFNLRSQRGEMQFTGQGTTQTMGINGDFLAPTLRVRKGEQVQFNVTNALDEETSLHWHGMRVPGEMDGGPHQTIAAGETWTATYPIIQVASTNWYHPHVHESTAEQVYAGIAGMLIVDDDEADTLDLPRTYDVDDFPVVIQDRDMDATGVFAYSLTNQERMRGKRGNTFLINGQISPTLQVGAKEIRLRLLNGSNSRIYDLEMSDGSDFKIIANDQSLLEQPVTRNQLTMSPGERYEIVVDLSERTGDRFFLTDVSSAVNLFTIEVGEAPATQTRVPDTLVSRVALDAADAVRTRPFLLAMRMGAFTINGQSMEMDVINETLKLDEVEIWELQNTSIMDHNFHVHGVHFKILDRSGGAPAPYEVGLKDTIYLPAQSRARVILKFTDYEVGARTPYMYHCHILEHEDAGMMGQFTVSA